MNLVHLPSIIIDDDVSCVGMNWELTIPAHVQQILIRHVEFLIRSRFWFEWFCIQILCIVQLNQNWFRIYVNIKCNRVDLGGSPYFAMCQQVYKNPSLLILRCMIWKRNNVKWNPRNEKLQHLKYMEIWNKKQDQTKLREWKNSSTSIGRTGMSFCEQITRLKIDICLINAQDKQIV